MPKAKLVTDINNSYFTNNKITVGTAAPTSGTYKAGDVVYSSAPNSTAFGWICTASGTPGSWKVLKSGTDVTNIDWNNIIGRPGTYPPDIGNSSTTAFRGDLGAVAYNHSQQAHAPSNAQRNADITKAEIEAKLTDIIETHTHYSLRCKDNRGENTPPCNYYVGFETNLKNRSTVNYPPGDTDFTAIAAIKPWRDRSGGAATQLSFTSVGEYIPKLGVRVAPTDDDRWGDWADIFTSLDHMITIHPRENNDFGFGVAGKAAGMIGCFKGWDKDRLYINTYSDAGERRSSYGAVEINGNVDLGGYTTAHGGMTVHNLLYSTADISTDKNLYVPTGMISVGGFLDNYGGANIRNGMNVWGTLTAKDQFNTDKDAYIGGSITVEHQVYVRRNVDIAGRTDLRGILNVEGESVLRSFVTAGNGMRVWGYMTAEDGLSVGGADLYVDKSATIANKLYVTNGISTDGSLYVPKGMISLGGFLDVYGGSCIRGNTEIQGECRLRQDPGAAFVDPWADVLCAIKVHGHIAATDVIKCRNFASDWSEISGHQLFIQWDDPGWGNEGAIWIRS